MSASLSLLSVAEARARLLGRFAPPPVEPAPLLHAAGPAARIMTGEPVPEGAEAVVPLEDTNDPRLPASALPERVVVNRPALTGENIRPAGLDVQAGQTVLEAGTRLGAAAIGILAALGRAVVLVHQRPVVGVLSTG